MRKVSILDSTLRDGAQGRGLSFTIKDKMNIVKTLDDFGVDYIEAGNPFSNPKDMDFFSRLSETSLAKSKVVAFGSTRRKGNSVDEDLSIKALIRANTPTVSIVGKTSCLHLADILCISMADNLEIIRDTIRYLKAQNRRVIFDAEHFFDGYKENSEYALEVLKTALESGADIVCLCDTNGGTMPLELHDITKTAVQRFGSSLGVHCHNDCGCAVANSIIAVNAGINHIQGTFLGYGERCGNADLSTIIPDLALKLNMSLSYPLENLCDVSRKIAQFSNLKFERNRPYVGDNAFVHKGGMHIDGVLKLNSAFEHVSPSSVGNRRHFLISEVSGRNAIQAKLVDLDISGISKESPYLEEILNKLKEMEYFGYQFEVADASLELLARKIIGLYEPFFKLIFYKTTGDFPSIDGDMRASAIVKITVKDRAEIAGASGCGPVHALDLALRRALLVFFPQLEKMQLSDYKVRVIEQNATTSSKVRVIIETTDGDKTWTTIGVSEDIIEASLIAIIDSIEYFLVKGGIECQQA